MKKHFLFIVSVLAISLSISAQSSGFKELDQWVDIWKEAQQTFFGYPINEQSALSDFYK